MPRSLSSIASVAISLVVVALVGTSTGAMAEETAATKPAAGDARPGDAAQSFERDIRPIFRAHCFGCHGAEEELQGKLDLRLVRLMVKGGDSGAALVPGDAAGSLLLKRIRAGEMPPGNTKMPAAEVALIERWIAGGAKTARAEPESLDKGISITPEDREFWAFQPVRKVEPPAAPADARVRTPVDAFLWKTLQSKGLSFAPDADRATLIRRAYVDLIGLPPTPAQVDAFVRDESPDAYEKLVDALLASPHYGERWARHWLDVAGYADSEGATAEDRVRDYAWKYRDYVVRALNADKPFDQFLIEQLAGDELVTPPHKNLSPEQIDKLVATGFLRMAIDGTANVDNDEVRNQVVGDTIKIVSTSLLALSVGCAQCHDHRYDPIPQTDYYRLRALFEPSLNWKTWMNPVARHVSLYTDADRTKAAQVETEAATIAKERNEKQTVYLAEALEKELEKFPEAQRGTLRTAYQTAADKRTPEQQKLLKDNPSVNISPGVLYQYNQKAADDLKAYDQKIDAVRKQKPVEDFVRALWEPVGNIAPTYLFHRGDHRQPKQQILPGDLTILAPAGQPKDIPEKDPAVPTSGRRLAYAKWLTSGQHPLVARVFVNRVWMHHFGRGLVATPSDFGRLGDRPSHPELLDWLAAEFQGMDGAGGQRGRGAGTETASNSATESKSRATTDSSVPPSPPAPLPSGPRGLTPWSLKSLHRMLLLSTAYRQSARRTAEADAVDGDNRLYSRWSIRRLDAEALRDGLLHINGTLDLTAGGPPTPVMADDAGQIIVPDAAKRRSLYLQVRRSQPVAFLAAFDAPVMEVNCERRPVSTVATQALMLMNSDFALKQAAQLVDRAAREAPPLDPAAVPSVGLPLRPSSVWKYGYGRFNDETKRVADFVELPHWTGSSWQGGPTLPDAKTGWVLLRADGGHPGDPAHAAVRRWIAPAGGVLSITGKLSHGGDQGNGVRGRVVSSRAGAAGEWAVKNSEAATTVEKLEVQPGDTIDLVTDPNGEESFDSFAWVAKLTLNDAAGKPIAAWETNSSFQGPPPKPLADQAAWAWTLTYGRPPTRDELAASLSFLSKQLTVLANGAGNVAANDRERQALTNFCQALLGSNRFLYVD